jgi:hypothetical protein
MRKYNIIVYILIYLAAFTLSCTKKQVSQSTTDGQSTSSTAVDYNAYVGTYKMNQDNLDANVTFENNRLYGQVKGRPKTELKPDGKDTFSIPLIGGSKVVFRRDTNQKVNGLVLYYNGEEITADKVE